MGERMVYLVYFLSIFLIPTIVIADDHALNVGSQKQLFIDNKFIEQSHNIILTVNPPNERGPVISSDYSWEVSGLGYNNVLDDEGQFKMWYMSWAPEGKSQYGRRYMCY